MAEGEVLLRVEGIRKRFGGVHALDDVSFAVVAGRVHCLAGENGSGKSTLIKIVSGAEVADEGTIIVSGRGHTSLTPHASIKEGIQVVYQDLSMFPNLTVAENIAIGPAIATGKHAFSAQRARAIAIRTMKLIGVEVPVDALVSELPIASRQITAICRALAQQVRVLFMDEPTTALTWREVHSLFEVISRLRGSGVGVVVVSHKFNEILGIADEITVLRNGRVTAAGPIADFDRASLSRAMTGTEVSALDRRTANGANAAPALQVDRLSVTESFEDVSFTLAKGEILGLTGLLGSGREMVAEALFGLCPIVAGTVAVDGAPQTIRSVRDALAAGLGYVPGDRLTEGLFLNHSIAQNVVAAHIGHIQRWLGLVTNRAVIDIGDRMVNELKIKTSSSQAPVRTLSGGNQQRVVLAKWLLREPKVLMCNGPTVGVDIGSKREILTLLRGLSDNGGAIIIISDDVPELVEVCDRVLIMRSGRLAVELRSEQISEERIHAEMVA